MKPGSLAPLPAYAVFDQGGMSSVASGMQLKWQELFKHLASSIAIGEQQRNLETSLNALAVEAATDNWDRQGANRLNQRSLAYARKVAQMLPVTSPPPEVSVDPDGEVSFDWQADARKTLSVSIDPTGTFRFAAIVGGSENYGVEPWEDALPPSIFRILERVAV